MALSLQTGGRYALLNFQNFYYITCPHDYPTRVALQLEDSLSTRTAGKQLFVVTLYSNSPLIIRLSSHERMDEVALISEEENAEVNLLQDGWNGPFGYPVLWEVGAAPNRGFSDFYRIRNTRTKTCLTAMDTQTQELKVTGNKESGMASQFWKFIPVRGDNNYEVIQQQLVKAQRDAWQRHSTLSRTRALENEVRLKDAVKEGQDLKARADGLERELKDAKEQLGICTCKGRSAPLETTPLPHQAIAAGQALLLGQAHPPQSSPERKGDGKLGTFWAVDYQRCRGCGSAHYRVLSLSEPDDRGNAQIVCSACDREACDAVAEGARQGRYHIEVEQEDEEDPVVEDP